ncbi:ARID DNA-binding domain-containing protein [Tanacetum coccineum]|uniref:ARID DNA-binding domain-containing protein n=1 Tax=Tanacetum coccineum TaxID=301880 RepID=A0ABQ4WWU6_9ASTR
MSPTKSLFKRLKNSFKVKGTEQERKIIFSHGIGEAMVETSEKKIVIPYVLYTIEITLNVLSLNQLMAQGFMVTYGHNKCQISYMFEEDKEGCDGETDCATSKEGNGCDVEIKSRIAKHKNYLEEYFDSIDSKDAIRKYLERGNVKIDLLGLYKMVDSMGGYLSVSFRNRMKEVVAIHGLTKAHEEDLKACYKRTIDMVKFCYDTTLRPWLKEEPVKCEKTKKVEGGCDHAKEENPQEQDGSSKNGLGVVRENTLEYFENVQRSETLFGVILEGKNDMDVD